MGYKNPFLIFLSIFLFFFFLRENLSLSLSLRFPTSWLRLVPSIAVNRWLFKKKITPRERSWLSLSFFWIFFHETAPRFANLGFQCHFFHFFCSLFFLLLFIGVASLSSKWCVFGSYGWFTMGLWGVLILGSFRVGKGRGFWIFRWFPRILEVFFVKGVSSFLGEPVGVELWRSQVF